MVREAMDAKGWSQTDLAFALGTTTAAVNQILNNKRSISQNMAVALSTALDQSAEMFARVQAEWDVRNADRPDRIAARSRILSRYPLREMMGSGGCTRSSAKGHWSNRSAGFLG